MRVLLVNPGSGSVFHTLGIGFPPLGLLYLAAAVRDAGFPVEVLDRMVDRRPVDFRPYAVVGIHCDTTRFHQAMQTAREARRAGARVVLGGPHPCFDSDTVFASGDVDAIVCGEGERTFVELLRRWDSGAAPENIPGLLVRVGGRILDGGPAQPIRDVDHLPMPARDLVDLSLYSRTQLAGRPLVALHTSRGCPFQCRFCASSRIDGAAWRARSAAGVLAELEHLVDSLGYRAAAFLDDNFAGSPERVHAICDGILHRGWDLRWWCFCRVDTILRHPDMIAHMARAGCHSIFVGVESPSARILAGSHKGIRAGQAREALAILKANRIEIWASYILGFPEETRADLRATIRFARELDSDTAQFTLLTPYPGTVLWDELEDRLIQRAGKGFDGVHAVYRHPRIPPLEMQLWHLWAYISFYLRNKKAITGFWRFLRLRKFGLSMLARGVGAAGLASPAARDATP